MLTHMHLPLLFQPPLDLLWQADAEKLLDQLNQAGARLGGLQAGGLTGHRCMRSDAIWTVQQQKR